VISVASLQRTDRLQAAAAIGWDAIVVGAGPAGSIAARQIARAGKSVLLVDKAAFPRPKVCGSCLSATGAALLERIGLGHVLRDLGSPPLNEIKLAAAGRSVSIALPRGGTVASRESLDAALVREAIAAGVTIIDRTRAQLHECGRVKSGVGDRIVELADRRETVSAATKAVVAADGLGGGFLNGSQEFRRITARDSLIGAGAVLASARAGHRPGTIYMAVGRGGYVGQVVLEDGGLDIAAALDRRMVANAGNPADAARRIVEQAGLPWPGELSHLKWHGTPSLTRRLAHVAAHRVFVVGDAGVYVEPFTGEGMTWAMLTGAAVAPFACNAIDGDARRAAERWEATHRRLLGRRMVVCRAVCRLFRSERIARSAVAVANQCPFLAKPVVRILTGSHINLRQLCHPTFLSYPS
jgi:flavin-dependent dehydrogenase